MKDLPSGWEWKRMKVSDVAVSVHAGGTPRRNNKDYWDKGNIPWLKISDIKSKYIDSAEEKITRKGLDESAAKVFPKGTIVYTIFATLGETAILNFEASSNQAIAGIVPNNKIVDTEYLYYCLKSEKNNMLQKKSHGTQDNINLSILRNHEIPVPPLPVQKRIVAILERAEKLKERRQQANDETNTIIQSLFYEMFGENKYPSEEILTRIEEVASRDPTKRPDDLFKYVDIAGIDNQTGRIKEFKEILGKDAPSRARREIRENDIIVSTVRPNLNATALIPKELDNQICSTGFCILRCKKTLNPGYLFTITRQKKFVDELVSKMKGASYPAVTNTDVLKVKIPIPPVSLQNQFASLVEKIESLKQKQSESTSDINNLFDALMQKAFNGGLTL